MPQSGAAAAATASHSKHNLAPSAPVSSSWRRVRLLVPTASPACAQSGSPNSAAPTTSAAAATQHAWHALLRAWPCERQQPTAPAARHALADTVPAWLSIHLPQSGACACPIATIPDPTRCPPSPWHTLGEPCGIRSMQHGQPAAQAAAPAARRQPPQHLRFMAPQPADCTITTQTASNATAVHRPASSILASAHRSPFPTPSAQSQGACAVASAVSRAPPQLVAPAPAAAGHGCAVPRYAPRACPPTAVSGSGSLRARRARLPAPAQAQPAPPRLRGCGSRQRCTPAHTEQLVAAPWSPWWLAAVRASRHQRARLATYRRRNRAVSAPPEPYDPSALSARVRHCRA